ncbi:MAG: UvrD-helicase domain-containing protein, partial [Dehalococcoidia bacterium]
MIDDAFEPIDATARRRIRESLEETLLVEAGAGTGKTYSLVSRVVELVAGGHALMGRLAAITFTDAAAAELRDRIREGLERRAAAAVDDDERARCERGAAALDQAAIQTLHGFAGALLRERPLEAGLPPTLEVLDDVQAGMLFEDAWQAWLDTALDRTDLLQPLRVALSLGMTIGHLREAARLFHNRYDLVREAHFQDVPLPQPAAAGMLAVALPELDALCGLANMGEDDALVGHVREVSRIAARVIEDSADSTRVWRLLARSPSLTSRRGKQQDWDTDPATGIKGCQVIRERLKDLQALVDQELAEVRRAALMPLLQALRGFVLDYVEQRKRLGQAEFHDLLVWARDLLRDNILVRDYFRARFSH